uniref:Secreted protein n=1 Tax=Schistosoma mansoni TaxID=6183 RepID=A0A5K4F7A2_SCHMA
MVGSFDSCFICAALHALSNETSFTQKNTACSIERNKFHSEKSDFSKLLNGWSDRCDCCFILCSTACSIERNKFHSEK